MMYDPRTIFLDAAKDVVHIIGKEALGVEHGLNQPSDRAQRHVFRVRMAIPLDNRGSGRRARVKERCD